MKTRKSLKRNIAHSSPGRLIRETATLNDRSRASDSKEKQRRAKNPHPGVVYLWVTGDMDYIGKTRSWEEADAFITEMIRIGYYASIIENPDEKTKKLARWVKVR
jgi:hypothetical protein